MDDGKAARADLYRSSLLPGRFSILAIRNRVRLKKPLLREPHSSHSFLSDFILGSQDGLVNVLGILLGVSAATSDLRIIYVGALAALGAESISMGAVAYTSTIARRRQYLKEASREQIEMTQASSMEVDEVRNILTGWGYTGQDLDSMTRGISSNPKAMLEFMMSFELKLAPRRTRLGAASPLSCHQRSSVPSFR